MKPRHFLVTFALFLFLSHFVSAQETMKIGMPVPELKSVSWLPGSSIDGGLKGLRGKVVVLEFWATWCGPCVEAIPHLNDLAGKYRAKGVEFLAVSDESVERIQGFLKKQPISAKIGTDQTRANWKVFGIPSIPFTVIVGKDGNLLATTRPEKLTAEVLDKALAGQALEIAPIEGVPDDLDWDRLIEWKDGVVPDAYVIIKPIRTFSNGSSSTSDHVVGDGMHLSNLVQLAFQTDFFHLDWRLPEDFGKGTYRFAARVPKDQPEKLRPLMQSSVAAYFGIKAEWQVQSRDVLVLKRREGAAEPATSTAAQPEYRSIRGKITLRKQAAGVLANLLTNIMRKPVLDETGLSGAYDFDLEYQSADPKLLESGLLKAGFEVVPAKRDVKMLVVTKA